MRNHLEEKIKQNDSGRSEQMINQPNDESAEKAVLGSILIESGGCSLRSAMMILKPEMFYQDSLRSLFGIMVSMGPDIPLDAITIIDRGGKEIESLGGQKFILDILDSVGHSGHLRYYAAIVARLYWEREINRECFRLSECKDPCNLEPIISAVREHESVGKDRTEGIGDIINRAIEKHERKQERILYTVGIPSLDKLWGGCLPGEITTWAAAPGVGKSLLMVNIMRHCSLAGWRCLLVGTEMSNAEQCDRIISVFGGPSAFALRRGLGDNDWARFTKAAARLSEMGIRMMDNPEPSLADIESAIIESKPQVVFVDYLTHCSLPVLSKSDPMRLRIRAFMTQLHSIARRQNVVVHLTSQLNRQSYSGENKAPTMGELAESSSVEQESSRVVLLWEPPMEQQHSNERILQAINCKSRESKRRQNVGLRLCESSLVISEIVTEQKESWVDRE